MTAHNPFKYFKASPKIIRLAVMYYIRYPLSFRQVEDILHERGVDSPFKRNKIKFNRFPRVEILDIILFMISGLKGRKSLES